MKPTHALDGLLPGLTPPRSAPLRHALGRRPAGLRAEDGQRLNWIALTVALAAAGWLAYHVGALPSSGALLAPLLFPLALLQCVTCALALLWAADTVAAERQRGTWDILKTTSQGPELIIRARWSAVFYRLRPLLLILMLPRVLLVSHAVLALARYQGHHLDLYLAGTAASISIGAAVLLLAAWLTTSLLEVPVLLGLNAALGLLIAAAFDNRTLARAACMAVLIAELLLPTAMSQVRLEQKAEGTVEAIVTRSNPSPLYTGSSVRSPAKCVDIMTILQQWADGHLALWWDGLALVFIFAQVLMTQGLLILAIHTVRHPLAPKTC